MRRLVRAALVIQVVMLLAACSPLYVMRAGYEEAKILARRKSIVSLVENPATPTETREKLRLVLRARAFAEDSLGLETGKSYTTFSQLDSDTLAMIVSAAYKDRFEAYTWWFPIVGRVPYKGYFSLEKAREAAANLEEKGFDTYIRPTSAFSTLGWFNDPLVSPLLRYDSVSLAATVIHELLHNTIYLPGQVAFNESFAEFVGSRGAIMLFCEGAPASESADCRTAQGVWQDELVFGGYLDGLIDQLNAVYDRSDLQTADKIRLRDEVLTRGQQIFADSVQPRLRIATYASFAREPLNNATLISRRLYYHRLDLFEQIFQRYGSDLRRTIQVVLDATREVDDPYAAVEALVR